MFNPLVSVIIPVFNAENYLSQCIESVQQQQWKNYEIIIVDDGSTDKSLKIAWQYESEFVKIFSQSNKGASSARNLGFKHARGLFIQFLDADDILSTDKISAQINCLKDHDNYLSLCQTVHFKDGTNHHFYNHSQDWYIDGSDEPVDFLIKLYASAELMPGYGGMIQPNAWLIPRNIIENAGLWNEDLSVDDDGEFFCRMVLASKGIKYASAGINFYRKYTVRNSLSVSRNYSDYSSELQAIHLKFEHLSAVTNNPILDSLFARYYWEIGVKAYPKFKDLSHESIKRATDLNFIGTQYQSGPFTNFLTKTLGWKVARRFAYWKNGF